MLQTLERIFWIVLGYAVNNYFIFLRRSRTNIIYFIQSISMFGIDLPATATQPVRNIPIFTHTLFIRNNGNRTAHNIEVTHPLFMPLNIFIFPQNLNPNIDRTRCIIGIPLLRPNETITISYLDTRPYDFKSIFATQVRSDEGLGRSQSVTLYPLPPRWAMRLTYILMWFGFLFILWIIYKFLPTISQIIKEIIRIISH